MLCVVFCFKLLLALEDFYGVLVFFSRENQTMERFVAMRPRDVFRCANAMKMCFCGIRKRNVFEAVASSGAGDGRFTMNLLQTKPLLGVCEGRICN